MIGSALVALWLASLVIVGVGLLRLALRLALTAGRIIAGVLEGRAVGGEAALRRRRRRGVTCRPKGAMNSFRNLNSALHV